MLMDATNSALKQIDAAFRKSNGVTTDTRDASPGKLFFALKGDRFDGNEFALQALESGCTLAVVDDKTVALTSELCIAVDDVLTALQALAQLHRSRWDFPVIGLTGSNGKTTTKELLYTVLKKRFAKTYATRGNLNNHIGVPLTILEIPINAEMAIIEMGANAQGEIAVLAEIAQPTHGVIINIGEAHLEGFGGLDGVVKGKRELFRYFEQSPSPGKHIFVHARHSILLEISTTLERTCYGTPDHPPFVHENASKEQTVSWEDVDGSIQGPLHPYITGHHNHDNMMTAVAIGRYFNVTKEHCSQAIAEYNPTNNRSQWRQTEHNLVLIDAYNANPSSMSTTLEHFAQAADNTDQNSICIIGDMAELGDFGSEAHDRILKLALDLNLIVWTVGPLFQQAAAHCDVQVKSFADTSQATTALKELALKNHRILLKGSRSIALEQLVDCL